MKTLKALRERERELKADGKKILDGADAANRALTDAEDKAFAAIETELAALAGDIATAEKAAERRRSMEGSTEPAASQHARIEVGQDRAALDPRAGFASIGEFARAVHRANPQTAGGGVDQRLAGMYASPTGYHREQGSNDGYLVPAEFRDRIWELVFEEDGLITEIDSEETNSNQVNDLTDDTTPWGNAGVQAYWRTEAGQMQASRLAQNPRSCKLDELYAFVLATDELLEDAPRLNGRLSTKAAQAINWKLDQSIGEGTGVGQPLGYMKSGALVTVAKETGQAADTILALNVANMFSRMLPSSLPRAYWRVNSDIMPQLMTMTIGDRTIWTPPATGFKDAPGGVLLGRPVKFSEQCSTLGDKGDIQFIDPKGYYGLKKAGGVKFGSSIHLYFDYGMQAFRWTVRFGGQPHMKAPLSPAKGTATKSHFVVLADRA